MLVTGAEDGTINIWDSDTFIHSSRSHSDSVKCILVLDNGNLASGSVDKTIKIWDHQSFECVDTLRGHNHEVKCLGLLENGNLVSSSLDENIKIWKLCIYGNSSAWKCIKTISSESYAESAVNCLRIFQNKITVGLEDVFGR